MTALSAHVPSQPAPSADGVEASVRRALEDAHGVSGAFAVSPCAFRRLDPEAARRLAPPRPAAAGGAGRWILVTCRSAAEAEHQTHLHERCLTAAQRFMLSLSCDGVDNVWSGLSVDADVVRRAGVELDGSVPVGLIRYG
ncbi:hypothetical protein RQM47_02350 [Rubrivirga sp. S365]|uniref:Nitroreductase family protein n=1 Tax=Rubrivirga litoralis TaxID=3075598 RepID=A0ABU3BQJ8_9BACT|nr:MULTISPECIES: hypothetical protein [unclassified Rubrivirga]MDT0631539.1 hypothetical protein [Rubrivirga sp. F394]MDT7855478.1 hypothetical protein [Rubrivirga sp. S365]